MSSTTKNKGPTLDQLKATALDLVAWYTSIEDSKTVVLQRLADVVIEIRSRFIDPETGKPDWRGKSYDYRQFMTAFYEETGLPPDSQHTIQASLRYHIGNRLRERVPGSELEAIGLKPTSPKERMAAARNEAAAMKAALDDGVEITSTRELVQRWTNYATAVERVVERLEHVEVDRLPPATALRMQELIEETIQHMERIARALQDRATQDYNIG